MPLSEETIAALRRVKEEIEEILSEVGDIIPDDYRMTCVLRYCGDDADIPDMVWTDDAHDDAIAALENNKAMLEAS